MTTQVIISSPKPNHQRLQVAAYYVSKEGHEGRKLFQRVELDEGQSTVMFVHGGMFLQVDEIPLNAAPAEGAAAVASEDPAVARAADRVGSALDRARQ